MPKLPPGAVSVPIDAAVARRVAGPDAWFGPLDPLPPVAPPEIAGRQFDYPAGWNLLVQPRREDGVAPEALRALAEGCDLVRLAIETRKDQLADLDWSIRRRGASGADGDPRIGRATALFRYPDREHAWDEWVRMLVEDMLVLDAATIYPRRGADGSLWSLDPVDGGTIKRVIDDYGRTPAPPLPAYQQILKGLPATGYTTDQLVYLPRNPLSHRVYGLSPVEQVLMTINIALRRQLHKLEYYTEGSLPDAFFGVPSDWTTEQLRQYQEYWDGLMSGNTAERRRMKFIHGDVRVVQAKEAILKDDFDEWLARIVCFAFAISPAPFVRQMNRSTAEAQDRASLREGLAPLMRWLKRVVDQILARVLGWPDLELAWRDTTEQDPRSQAEIAVALVGAGIATRNEARATLGLPPLPGADTLTTAGPAMPLGPDQGGDRPLAKYSDDQKRWPAGAPDSQGGRFAPEDAESGAAAPADTASPAARGGRAPVQLAQAEEPTPPPEGEDTARRSLLDEIVDPGRELRLEEYSRLQAELARIDRDQPTLSARHEPGWEPTQDDVDALAAAVRAAQERADAKSADRTGEGAQPPPVASGQGQGRPLAGEPTACSFETTPPVRVTGRGPIETARSYENEVRKRYRNLPRGEREYATNIGGKASRGLADDVTMVDGQNTAVEAKYVEKWGLSLRNRKSPMGKEAWADVEQKTMLDQAKRYSAGFPGGVIYVTNSEELAEHYSEVFRNAGIENFRFVITPAER